MTTKARQTNSELHSMRCDFEYKMEVGKMLQDEAAFYYPHNVDFRGRAYTIHPHLNHLGADVSRGLLQVRPRPPRLPALSDRIAPQTTAGCDPGAGVARARVLRSCSTG